MIKKINNNFQNNEINKKNKIWITLNKITNNPLFLAFIINISILLIAYFFNFPVSETNDDTGMAAILSGTYGVSAPTMIFSNIFYGYFIYFFYNMFPNIINWYSFFQLVISFISFWIIGYIILKKCGKKIGSLIYLCLLCLSVNDFYLILQFTRVSMLCSFAGLILLIEQIRNKKIPLFSIVWILLGALIRYKSTLSVLPCAFFYGLFVVFDYHELKIENYKSIIKKAIPYLSAVGVVFLLVVASIYLDTNYYKSDKEWSEYLQYNRLRADIMDYGWPSYLPDYDTYAEEYKELGISENDLQLYEMGILSDTENLSIEKLEEILEFKKKYTYREFNPLKAINNFRRYLKESVVLELFFIISFIYIIYTKKINSFLFCIFNFFSVFIMYYYLFSLNRVVNRAIIPIIFSSIISLCCYMQYSDFENIIINKVKYFLLILCNFLVFSVPVSTSYKDRLKSFDDYDVQNLFDKIRNNKEDIYIADRYMFDRNYNFYNSFYIYENNLLDRQINIGGWLNRSPIMNESMKRLGISNIYVDLIEKDNVLFYTKDNDKILYRYIKEHYDEDIAVSINDICYDSFTIKFLSFNKNKKIIKGSNNNKVKLRMKEKSELEDYGEVELSFERDFNIKANNMYIEISFENKKKTFSLYKKVNSKKYIGYMLIDESEEISLDKIKSYKVFYKNGSNYIEIDQGKEYEYYNE